MAKLLLVALGELSGAVLENVARRGLFSEIVVATRSADRAQAKVNNARIGAALEGQFPNISVQGFDLHSESAAQQLADIQPDVAFVAPSMMPWWQLDQLSGSTAACVQQAPFATFVACHLAPMHVFRQRWQESKLRCPWVGASYPDVVNPVLHRTGTGPSCGVGNVLEALPKVYFVAQQYLGLKPSDITPKLVAQHAFEYSLYNAQGGDAAAPPFHLHVDHAGEDISEQITPHLFTPFPIPYKLDFNLITASASVAVLSALLSPTPIATHAPAPNGALGGYPVRISREGIVLDLPPGLSVAEAEAVNRASLPFDGITAVDDDGTILFTPDTQEAFFSLLGQDVASLCVGEAAALAQALVECLSTSKG